MDYLVSADWLKSHLKDENLVVVDVRFSLSDPDEGYRLYEKEHIPGAFYFDLNKDMSSSVKQHGGNHPLPDTFDFANKLGAIGINQDTTVVIYDQSNDMFSARLWWLLYYMGHDQAYVLDGGLSKWIHDGNHVTADIPAARETKFNPDVRKEEVLHIDDVKARLADNAAILLDSRAKERYLGKTEPLYKKAGHIPGAKNYFWKDVLNKEGSWKSESGLQKHFKNLGKNDEIIVSCGSGVSACPNILGLKIAGYENVKLYPGSYSDWISYDENNVATEEE